MQSLFLILRDVVWSAILAVVFAGLAILCAIINPTDLALPVAFGTSAITSALLAQRA
jgi:hypothetical protein